MTKENIGEKCWVIPEGYIPGWSNGPTPEMTSHEAACILNVQEQDANIEIMIYFEDKDPLGPYRIVVPAKRTKHLRFNNLHDPAPVPVATGFASLITSDVPIIVQHTRLDSRQAQNALISTMAFPVKE